MKRKAYKIYNYNTNKTKSNTRRNTLPTNSITKNLNNTQNASDIRIVIRKSKNKNKQKSK